MRDLPERDAETCCERKWRPACACLRCAAPETRNPAAMTARTSWSKPSATVTEELYGIARSSAASSGTGHLEQKAAAAAGVATITALK